MKKLVLLAACLLVGCVFAFSSPKAADETAVDSSAVEETLQRGGHGSSFDHRSKEHSKINCSACHKVSAAQPEVRDFPGHLQCINCHRHQNFAEQAIVNFSTFCTVCHRGKPISKNAPKMFDFVTRTRQLQSDFGIDFSHVAHRKPLPQDLEVRRFPDSRFRISLSESPKCDDCHQRIEPRPANAPEMVIEKGHSTCFQCHNEKPQAARPGFPTMNDCGGCHELGGPNSANLFGKVRAFHHADHEFDTRPIRKADFRRRATDYLCAECHATVDRAEKLSDIKLPQEQTCNLCHNGRLGLPDALEANVLRQLRQ